jgi:hypothetical protein
MIRALGWTLVALTAFDQFVFHGTYTAVASQMLSQILARV